MATKKKSPLTLKQRRERNLQRERFAHELTRLKIVAGALDLPHTRQAVENSLTALSWEMAETNQK